MIIKVPLSKIAVNPFNTLELRTASGPAQKHRMTCSGKTAAGTTLKETSIELCRELGIKFETTEDLVAVLRKDFPTSYELDMLISFLDPQKVAT